MAIGYEVSNTDVTAVNTPNPWQIARPPAQGKGPEKDRRPNIVTPNSKAATARPFGQ